MINDDCYRKALGYVGEFPQGGQELIMPEIIALFATHAIKSLWLPFSIGPLKGCAERMRIAVATGRNRVPHSFDALYFGTPTIVDGKALFPDSDPHEWNVGKEAAIARDLCSMANRTKECRLIISGLGSGDVSAEARVDCMKLDGWSRPRMVAWKLFSGFEDSVFAMTRHPVPIAILRGSPRKGE